MNQKFPIIIFFLLLAGSVLFLFWRNQKELDPNYNKNWWTLSFAVPENPQSLDFAVENFGKPKKFDYRIVNGQETLAENSFALEGGEKKMIAPNISAPSDTRTSIIVTTGNEKKEIYR